MHQDVKSQSWWLQTHHGISIQMSINDDHVCNEKELRVLVPADPSTHLIHCIYEMHSKAHGIGAAASQSR